MTHILALSSLLIIQLRVVLLRYIDACPYLFIIWLSRFCVVLWCICTILNRLIFTIHVYKLENDIYNIYLVCILRLLEFAPQNMGMPQACKVCIAKRFPCICNQLKQYIFKSIPNKNQIVQTPSTALI